MGVMNRLNVSALGLALLVLAYAPSSQAEPTGGHYVAMGSSFAAGPGITKSAEPPPARCRRSADNYAHQLAARRKLALTDVSCSGATTDAILEPWGHQPAQIEAVLPETTLVTVTIGGNDLGYMTGLMAAACQTLASNRADPVALDRCGPIPHPDDADYVRLEAAMTRIAVEVKARAPSARLVFVNYLTVLPQAGSCALAPLAPEAAKNSRTLARKLLALTAKVAKAQGAEVFSAASLSRTHSVCARHPWMNGYPAPAGGAAFHPNLAGMTAVAEGLDRQLFH